MKLSFLCVFGGDSGGVTPVPIPNTEVKPSSADGTAWVTVRESRTLPDFLKPFSNISGKGFFLPSRHLIKNDTLPLTAFHLESLVQKLLR